MSEEHYTIVKYSVGMETTRQQRELLERHLELVLEYNKKLNLTRIDSIDEAWVLHVEDSLAALDTINQAPQGPVADMGSGSGYPGIPLAIATDRKITLIESVAKKARALIEMVEQLDLTEQVTVRASRTEEVAQEHPGGFAVVTARALSSLPSLLELASPLLQLGGWFVGYKSKQASDEIEQAEAMQQKVGMSLLTVSDLVLSDGTPRTIVMHEKQAEPTVKLPRRPGMAQSRPYTK